MEAVYAYGAMPVTIQATEWHWRCQEERCGAGGDGFYNSEAAQREHDQHTREKHA